MGEARTCPPYPAGACGKRLALFGRDTPVSALSLTRLRSLEERLATHGRDTHVFALPRACVRGALRAICVRHARFRPGQHLSGTCVRGTLRYVSNVTRWITRTGGARGGSLGLP